MNINTGSSQKVLNIAAAIFLAAAALGLTLYLVVTAASGSAEKLFWSAIDQSLSTSGVTRRYSAESDTQKMVQTTRTNYAGSLQVDTTLEVSSPDSGDSSVSQLLGTIDKDYIRYREITGGGRELSADIKDAWAELPVGGEEGGQLLKESIIGTILPTGNFNAKNRRELIKTLRDNGVYTVGDFKQRGLDIEGRKTDVITISVDTSAYQRFLKEYLQKMGMQSLADTIELSADAGSKVDVDVAIHPLSSQIVKFAVDSIDNPSAEVFSQWGNLNREKLPESTVSFSELQSGLLNTNQ